MCRPEGVFHMVRRECKTWEGHVVDTCCKYWTEQRCVGKVPRGTTSHQHRKQHRQQEEEDDDDDDDDDDDCGAEKLAAASVKRNHDTIPRHHTKPHNTILSTLPQQHSLRHGECGPLTQLSY